MRFPLMAILISMLSLSCTQQPNSDRDCGAQRPDASGQPDSSTRSDSSIGDSSHQIDSSIADSSTQADASGDWWTDHVSTDGNICYVDGEPFYWCYENEECRVDSPSWIAGAIDWRRFCCYNPNVGSTSLSIQGAVEIDGENACGLGQVFEEYLHVYGQNERTIQYYGISAGVRPTFSLNRDEVSGWVHVSLSAAENSQDCSDFPVICAGTVYYETVDGRRTFNLVNAVLTQLEDLGEIHWGNIRDEGDTHHKVMVTIDATDEDSSAMFHITTTVLHKEAE